MSAELPIRSSTFGVGKEIGGAVYVHRMYEHKLGSAVVQAKVNLPDDFDYQVVKYNYRTKSVSFIQSQDFDVAPEPTVGDIVTVGAEGEVRRRSPPLFGALSPSGSSPILSGEGRISIASGRVMTAMNRPE
jgi:hypothetical protein